MGAAHPSQPVQGKGSEALTHGVRVNVWPTFLPDQSDLSAHRYVFAYRIRIANESSQIVQLLSRKWRIIDADGQIKEVQGEGVVGQQPTIAPGHHFEYSSFCPLETPWGTMEGSYTFETEHATVLEVKVGRFYLIGPTAPKQTSKTRVKQS